MPSGDHSFNVGNISNRTPQPNVGQNVPDKGTGVVPTKLGNSDVTVKTSNEHIDLLKPNANAPMRDSSPSVEHRESSAESTLGDDSMDFGSVTPNTYTPPEHLLKDRGIKVVKGAFLGSMAGAVGIGIGAVSSAGFAAKLAVIGGIVGTAIFPGAGTFAGAVIGGAIGALAGGATGAAIGALAVKGGSWIKSQFNRSNDSAAAREEYFEILDDLKEEYVFGTPRFNRLAEAANIDPNALEAKKEEIENELAFIFDSYKSTAGYFNEEDSLQNLALPSEPLLESALTGLMKIHNVSDEIDAGLDGSNQRTPLKKLATESFGEFLANHPTTDPSAVDMIADAFIYILTSPNLSRDAKEIAMADFASALDKNKELEEELGVDPMTANEVAAIGQSATDSLLVQQTVQRQLSGNRELARDLISGWQDLVRPFVRLGRPINKEFANAVLPPLQKIVTGSTRASTRENFGEFVLSGALNGLALNPKAAETVAEALVAMDQKWTGTNEGLAVAQEEFVDWAGKQMTLGNEITVDLANEYFSQNYIEGLY
jgi:hypothetical protein